MTVRTETKCSTLHIENQTQKNVQETKKNYQTATKLLTYGASFDYRTSDTQDHYLHHKTRNTFCGTRYLSHCWTIPDVGSQQTPSLKLKLSPFATSDIITHVTTGFIIYGFLYVVSLNQPSTLHGCRGSELQKISAHDLDLSKSRDVIGHVTTGLAMCTFLWVVLSRIVAEILCVKHSAKHIPTNPNFCVLGGKIGGHITL